MKAFKGDKVKLILNTDGAQFFWVIQKDDDSRFYFSNSQHWTDDLFEIHTFWFHHTALNMAIRKEFDIVKLSLVTFELVDDQLYVFIDDKQVEIVDNIISDKEARAHIKAYYAYQFNKEGIIE